MKTEDRARYKNIGDKGDTTLSQATISIAGIGSVGASVASMLGREHINLRMMDMGRVEERDMHRTAIFYEEDIAKFKVKQAKARIQAITPTVRVKSFHEEISDNNIFLLKGDLIIDATNNPEVNKLTLKHAIRDKTPLIIVRYGGDTSKMLVLHKKIPAKMMEKLEVPNIMSAGIFGPLTSMTAAAVVTQATKIILGEKKNKLIELDIWKGKIKTSII
ncbi:ThiF family adenylyltransferase [Candidatus Woesearchaeota archaeon]|nr:ThiF family adenylyltransferase [Candidatus Woesearchaeota archaeon]